MNKAELVAAIFKKQSYLCIGLDPDPKRIPEFLWEFEDPIFEFNKAIIDATKAYCVAFKPNLAFYEAQGLSGMVSLQKSLAYIPQDLFTIADAKRGDIGTTSRLYAQAFFETLNFDAITVAPYMGQDSVLPFLEFPDKWVILLALTSNAGAEDFQKLSTPEVPLYHQVLQTSKQWGDDGNMMYVVGATQADNLRAIREIVPDHFLLVPGVGAQGGDLKEVSRLGLNHQCGLLVNASRSIIYASSGEDFAEAAAREAASLQSQMANLLQDLPSISGSKP